MHHVWVNFLTHRHEEEGMSLHDTELVGGLNGM